eukprot:TRINITY_DN2707_c0_g1_i2.p1 TRINITY_DN2707_c0_g1~~TRINITY_DN2707_c0_g1_i2.p1  ORF type:complete len:162 (+),score=19.23 TRINITY_DN2707_c0_g1_i2:82-567(+)
MSTPSSKHGLTCSAQHVKRISSRSILLSSSPLIKAREIIPKSSKGRKKHKKTLSASSATWELIGRTEETPEEPLYEVVEDEEEQVDDERASDSWKTDDRLSAEAVLELVKCVFGFNALVSSVFSTLGCSPRLAQPDSPQADNDSSSNAPKAFPPRVVVSAS